MMESNDGLVLFAAKAKLDALILGGFLLLLWGLRFVDGMLLKGRLNDRYAIRPRQRLRPTSIVVAQLLHSDRRHLFGNSVPLLILGWMVMLPETNVFWAVTAVIILVGGLGIWLLGSAATLGASGLVMGYFGFVLSRGFFERNTGEVLFALAIAMFYAGLFRQILPRQKGISAAGHFFGFLGGIAAAWLLAWYAGWA